PAESRPARSRRAPRDVRSAARRAGARRRRARRRRCAGRDRSPTSVQSDLERPMQCARTSPSRLDDDLSCHLLVPAAAEDVAVEGEGPRLVRHDAQPGDLARLDALVDLQIGDLEAVLAIERGQLEYDWFSQLQLDD